MYRSPRPIRSFLRNFYGLPFLHPEDIEDCIHSDFNPIAPDNANIDTFVEYVLANYVTDGCSFPPQMWASFDAHKIRTTNACEAFHSKVNSMFYHAHPDIFSLIDALMEIQEVSYLKMRNPPRTIITPSGTILESYMLKLRQQEITRFDFVHDLSRKFLPIKIKK